MTKSKFTAKKSLEPIKKLDAAGYALFVDDNGHDSHKSVTVSPDGTTFSRKVPSLVGVGNVNIMTDINGAAVGCYVIDDESYTCSETLGRESQSLLDSYQYSNENLALFSNCIERLGIWDKKLIVATTLPVKRMDVDDNQEKVKAQFKKVVARHAKQDKLQIAYHLIMAEGQAAFFDWAINYDSTINAEVDKISTVLVVDIGGGTTDLVSITSSGGIDVSVDKSRCFTFEDFGLVALKDEVSRLVKAALIKTLPDDYKQAAQHLSPNTINAAFDTGFVSYMMLEKPIDLTEDIQNLKRNWVKKLLRKIISNIERLDNYNKILIVGGGGVALQPEINQALPGCAFLDEYANANGLMKLMVCVFASKFSDKYALTGSEA